MHMFCSNVRSQVFKLYLKFLNCLFMGYSLVKKGIGVIVPHFDVTLCLLMLHSLKLPCFPFRLLSRVWGGGGSAVMMIYWFIMFSYWFLLQLSFLLNLQLLRFTLDVKTP